MELAHLFTIHLLLLAPAFCPFRIRKLDINPCLGHNGASQIVFRVWWRIKALIISYIARSYATIARPSSKVAERRHKTTILALYRPYKLLLPFGRLHKLYLARRKTFGVFEII